MINGETHDLWRAVDREDEVLESYFTKRRDRKAAFKFIRKPMKRYGDPAEIVTDKLRSYGAAMRVIGNAPKQETGRSLNNRAENFHLPFRRRERGRCFACGRCEVCKICCRSFLNSEPFRPGAPPLLADQFQAQPNRCSSRMAWSRCGISGSFTVLAETSSWSDSVRLMHPLSADAEALRKKCGLGAVANADLSENGLHVHLHCGVSDAEPPSDELVG